VSGVNFIRAKQNGGFIQSCNLGAEKARGEYLVLLNNDIQVTAGWLDSLLKVFWLHADAGMVGARLVYPDGRLQEAGGIVWQDGSAWNWGRGDDPDRPTYRYIRAVDYCSGACLAIRMSDWRCLGGFDKAYAPAYYEDVDLAFRVRQLGLKVYYQPDTTIIHFEGISSGTDEASGVKRHQVINRDTLFERWKTVLKSHQPNACQPQREADRGTKARVLVVEACMVTPDQDAGSVRMLAMLELLVEIGCKVSFVADNIEFRQPYVGQLQQAGVEVWHHPFVDSVAQLLAERGKDFEVIMFCRHYIAARYLADIRKWAPQAKIVFDTVDLHYLREQRLAQLDGSKALLESAEATRQQELGVIAGSDLTLVVSSAEQELLAKELPSAAVDIVTIIHETRQAAQKFGDRTGLLFVGGFRHPPNVDAVTWFVGEVWPLVQKKEPEMTLTIVGSNMPNTIRELVAPNVVVAGFVENMDPLLDATRISVAPLRYGAGVKGKVNQAMACGLPVVATSVAAEGMNLQDGEDLLIADSPQAFANAVLRLYNDEALWNHLVEGGKRSIEANFSRTRAKGTLAALVGVDVVR
jgi:glycosyltransferase involved in cell wall biosynthesis